MRNYQEIFGSILENISGLLDSLAECAEDDEEQECLDEVESELHSLYKLYNFCKSRNLI